MNICIFAANYLPNIGGIERYCYYVSRELIKKGHTVTLVTNDVFNLGKEETQENGLKILRIPCINLLNSRYPIHKRNKSFKEIDKFLNQEDFDLFIINARFYTHSIYAARIAKKRNIKCFVIEHGCSHLSVNNKLFDFLGGIYEHLHTAVLKLYCKNYYAVSGTAGAWSGHFGIKSDGVLYNSVDVNEINDILANTTLSYKSKYALKETDKVITFTGRLIKEKGIYQLINAVNKLNRDDVYLFIAGDGIEFEPLKKLQNNNIILLGRLGFSEVISLLKESDIFCLPSVSEGMSTSVLEAIATKTLVITTQNSGAVELITDKSFGVITKSNTEEEIYAALSQVIDDTDYIKNATENSYKRLITDFTFSNTASKIVENWGDLK